MFPWLRRNLQSGLGPINLTDEISNCLRNKISYELSTVSLCSQFSGAREIKEAKMLANQERYSEALTSLGEHFMFRVHPKSLTQHSNITNLRNRLRRFSPQYIQNIIAQANACVEHRFSVGNSTPYHFKHGIDWFSDFAGHSWPRLHIASIDECLKTGEPVNLQHMGELARTLEFNRLDHFLTLGRAYWLSGTETYAAEFIVQAIKWCQENPPLLGVNWYDPQTVAIRAINWILALGMFIESTQLQPSQMAMFVEMLLNHGVLLAYWLSHGTKPTLQMVIALAILADWLSESQYAKHWHDVAGEAWDKAVKDEFNDDNFHRTTAPSQQMLSCEWLLLFALHCNACQRRLPRRLDDLLNDVLDSLQCLLTPADDISNSGGYPHTPGLMGQMCTPAMHVRNLLALGAVITNRAELYCNLPQEPPEMLWWLGENGWTDLKELKLEVNSHTAYLFSHTGLGVARDSWAPKATHCLFKANPSSLLDGNVPSLKDIPPAYLFHNDALSLTLTVKGEPILIEPGLASDWRNHDFRLSRLSAHSAPRLSHEIEPPLTPKEQNALKANNLDIPNAIFCSQLVGQKPNNQDQVQFGVRRYAYAPDGNRVTITRHVIFMPNSQVLVLRDKLEGQGQVPYEGNFLLSPHLYLMMRGDKGCRMLGDKTNIRIIPHLPEKSAYVKYKGSVAPFLGWYYNSNGQLRAANYLRYFHKAVALPVKIYYVILWDNRETDLPQPADIDKLIGE